MNTTLETVLAALGDIAPEVDVAHLALDRDVREQVDLDSMDFLNVMEELACRTGVEVPERDYPQVATIAGMVSYINSHRSVA